MEIEMNPRSVFFFVIQCKINFSFSSISSNLIFQVSYIPTEEGDHEIDLRYDGTPLPDSPFPVTAVRGCNPDKVKAYGDGLEKGIVDEPNSFTIETRNAGTGGLGIAVEGPAEAEMNCVDNKDGTCTVEYVPVEEGDYDVNIKFDDAHIPGSPFKVPVTTKDGKPKADARKVTAYGPGLEPGNVFPGKPTSFIVDASNTGEAPVEVFIGDGGDNESGADNDANNLNGRKGSGLDRGRKGSSGLGGGADDDSDALRRGSRLGSLGDDNNEGAAGRRGSKGLAALRGHGHGGLGDDDNNDDIFGGAGGSRKGSGLGDLDGGKGGLGSRKASAADSRKASSALSDVGGLNNKMRKPSIVDKGDGLHEVTYVPPPVGDPYEVKN